MASIDFVGEHRPAMPDQNEVTWLLRGMASVLGCLGALAAAIGGVFLGFCVTPFFYYDTLVICGVAIGPALMILGATTLLSPNGGGPMRRLDVLCGVFIFCVMVPGNYLLYLNEKLDFSPAVVEVLPVQEVWIRTGKHGSRSFMASVQADVKRPIKKWSLYGAQPVRLDKVEWDRLVPGQSALRLRIHRGRFGFAWYEPYPKIG